MDKSTNYNFNMPVLSDAPPDITKVSANFASLDTILKGHQDAIEARLPLAGGTMTGTISSSAEKVISTQPIPQSGKKELEFNNSTGRVGYVRVENSSEAHKISLGAVGFNDSTACVISAEVDSVGNVVTAAPTPATGDSSTKIATTAFVKNVLLDMIYPVGSIIFRADAADPADVLGGTWERIADGRCLISAGTNYPAGSVGGSADAIVPYHTHTFTGSAVNSGGQSVDHAHYFSAYTSESGNHTHLYATPLRASDIDRGANNSSWSLDNSGDYSTGPGGNHKHSVGGWTGGVSAGHTHSVTAAGTNSYAGVAGNIQGANLPPYVAVNIWKRTA